MWNDKHVAIAGFGIEGQSVLKFLRRSGVKKVTILDESGKVNITGISDVDTITGQNAFSNLSEFDVVFRSPSINPRRLDHKNVTSSTQVFFQYANAKIIGVTGSKGKGTTATLIYEILKASSITAHLIGNIGVPALDVLQDINQQDVVVFELSSFQLWDLENSPEISVVLMVEPEHLDIHDNLDDYIAAKSNITAHQKNEDFVTYHPGNKYSQEIALKSSGRKVKYLTPQGAYVENGVIKIDQQEILNVNQLRLIGTHNLENVCAAVTASWQITKDINAIRKVLSNFSGLKHRLEYIASTDGVKYYNDSIGTTPTSAIAAISAFSAPVIAIMGGSSKDHDYSLMAEKMAHLNNLKRVILIGQTADSIDGNLRKSGFNQSKISRSDSLQEAVNLARDCADSGEIVVLAPAAASFDMFKNYQDRGEQFIKAVQNL